MPNRGTALAIALAVIAHPATAWAIDDPIGDPAIIAYPTGTNLGPAPADSHGGLDIASLSIEPNLPKDALEFTIKTADAPAIPRETLAEQPHHVVYFDLGGRSFRVEAFVDAGTNPISATIYVRIEPLPGEPIQNSTLLWLPNHPLEDGGTTLRVLVPRLLLDEYVSLRPGVSLTNVQLRSDKLEYAAFSVENGPEFLVGPRIEDYAPEEPTSFDLSFGATYTDDLLIWSPNMIRASNGGATTIVFPMQLFSTHPETTISIDSIPPSWHVSIPINEFDRPVDGLVVPIIVTAQFVHAHGKMDFLTVTARGGGEVATAPIGIDYLDIPQPTGHHSTVWLHSTESGAENPFAPVFGALERMVMNTLRDDPRGRDAPIAGEVTASSPVLQTDSERAWRWEIPLDPAMRIGVDPIRNGTVSLGLDATMPQEGDVDWTARLIWRTASDAIMYEGSVTQRHDAGRQGFSLDLTPTREATKRPGGDHQNLVLIVEAQGRFATWTSSEEAGLFGGTSMRLPFHEYSDSVLGVLPPSDLSFGLETWSNSVPPGGQLSRTLSIHNHGNESKVVRLQAQGVDPIEVSVQPQEIVIGPNENRNVDARVIVPMDAPRQSFNAIVAVSDAGDVAVLQWEITANPDAVAQPTAKGGAKDTPGGALPLLLVAMGLAARQFATRR